MRAGRILVSTVLAGARRSRPALQQTQNTVLEAHRVTPKAGCARSSRPDAEKAHRLAQAAGATRRRGTSEG